MSASELHRGGTGWASLGWGRVTSRALGFRQKTELKETASKAGSRGVPGSISLHGRPWLPPGLGGKVKSVTPPPPPRAHKVLSYGSGRVPSPAAVTSGLPLRRGALSHTTNLKQKSIYLSGYF